MSVEAYDIVVPEFVRLLEGMKGYFKKAAQHADVLVQAIEILMDANACDADTAMSSLRDRAQSNHLSIDEVAATVVSIAAGEDGRDGDSDVAATGDSPT